MEREQIEKVNQFAIISLFVVILVVILFTTVRILNDQACGREDYTFTNNRVTQNGTVISTFEGYVLINLAPTEKAEYQLFCYTAVANSDGGLGVSVINEFEETLGYDVVKNTSTTNCVRLTTPNAEGFYIGLRCDDCDAANTLILKEEVLGDEVEAIVYDGEKDRLTIKSPVYNLKNYVYCYELLYYVIKWLSFFFMMLLMIQTVLYFTKSVDELTEQGGNI